MAGGPRPDGASATCKEQGTHLWPPPLRLRDVCVLKQHMYIFKNAKKWRLLSSWPSHGAIRYFPQGCATSISSIVSESEPPSLRKLSEVNSRRWPLRGIHDSCTRRENQNRLRRTSRRSSVTGAMQPHCDALSVQVIEIRSKPQETCQSHPMKARVPGIFTAAVMRSIADAGWKQSRIT